MILNALWFLGDNVLTQLVHVQCPVSTSGLAGRPANLSMAELGFTFQSMANVLGVSTRTLNLFPELISLCRE